MAPNQIHDLAYDALNAAVAVIQEKLGVKTGDTAGIYFSGDSATLEDLTRYIRLELSLVKDNKPE